jgi:N-acyl-D-amino-acid deacylase
MSEGQPFKLLQGVTTEIVGNCGFSAAPLTSGAAAHAMAAWDDLFPEVELHAWSFGEYLDRIQASGPSNNIAPLVGHGTLRLSANGMDAPLSDEARAHMFELAEEAFSAGAAGLSSGLIYAPGAYADTEELVELARVAARWRRPYTSHMRDEGEHLEEALDETIEIGRRSGARVQVSHCKSHGESNWGKASMLLDRLHAARVAGVDVHGDQYPYSASCTWLSALLPPAALEGGVDQLRARCADPDSLLALPPSSAWEPGTPGWTVVIVHADPAVEGKTLASIAEERGVDPFTALCSLVADDPGSTIVAHGMSDDDVTTIMSDPLVSIGSDNGPPTGMGHPRTWGCFPRFFGHYVREGGVVSWEEAIRKATSANALHFDLRHRGTVQPGSIADVCVFDPSTIGHPGTFEEPNVDPVGVRFVLLGGEIVIDGGGYTGARVGRVLRHGI